jgi:uncharacterized membrane protein YidH (DUF202 family)
MKTAIVLGVVLCIVGVVALVYGGFSFTHREKVIDLGPLQASVEKTESLPLPPIAGLIALVGGVALIVVGARKAR